MTDKGNWRGGGGGGGAWKRKIKKVSGNRLSIHGYILIYPRLEREISLDPPRQTVR